MLNGVDCIISSPPYAESVDARREAEREADRRHRERIGRNPHSPGGLPMDGYGSSPGQLAAMKPGAAPEQAMTTAEVPTTVWDGCYDGRWENLVVPESMAHPAKYSRKLIARIYQHLLATGRLAPGGVVVDCFGGVALGALDAMAAGLHWHGVELEERFHTVGLRNIALWERWLGWDRLPGPKGSARLACGDSRALCSLLSPLLCECVVSSPPYAETAPEKNSNGVDRRKQFESYRKAGGGSSFEAFCAVQERHSQGYGHTEGQLGGMKPGSVADAVIGSPPFEGSLANGKLSEEMKAEMRSRGHKPSASGESAAYGDTAGNLGNAQGETFWGAAKQIVAQSFAILKPGGCAVWVCKDFIRAKARVPFSQDWARLCQACGFRMVEWVKASLVKRVEEDSLFGGKEVKTTERASFFRRLATKKGSPRIDEEDVLVMTKDSPA
jgi:hypothetical protein